MKAPDGDVHSLYHTQIWVICLHGGGLDIGQYALSYLLVVMVVFVGVVATK